MREHVDAAGLRDELVRRGVPADTASTIVAGLAARPHMLRLSAVLPVLAVLADVGATSSEVADDAARMLRTHGYLPEPTRCRWCGVELHARSHVAVLVDGIACARCALSRGVS